MVSQERAFATCPKGLASMLRRELETLGATQTRETTAGVEFCATLETLYRVCLWSRLANRVLLHLTRFALAGAETLYTGLKTLAWEEHLAPHGTFAVDFSGTTPAIRHSHFGALKAKDAIVDYFRERVGQRPSVDIEAPDLRVNIRAYKGQASISLDLSGHSLHRRGYRSHGGEAPLKENLASALLLRANWPAIAAAGGTLLDPLCGSATLLTEGALMAMGIAPGLTRSRWGFDGWLGHVPAMWARTLHEAQERRAAALTEPWPDIFGYDASIKAIRIAEQNIARAGLQGRIRVLQKELARLVLPTHKAVRPGLVITNPPYGQRLGDEASLLPLYRLLGSRLKEEFLGWHAAMVTANPQLGKVMGLRACKQYQFWNGAIASKLLLFDVKTEFFVRGTRGPADASGNAKPALGEGAQMLANRLRKKSKGLARWVRQNAISCYRLYDADIPEYAVAIDVYDNWVHVAEYRAPDTVDPAKAEQRLRDVMSAVPAVLDVPTERVVVKQRLRQKGKQQYQKRGQKNALVQVTEGDTKLLVNLHDYLDTGLFLDHRRVRFEIARLAKQKRFLNLYCYTGAATVHAAVAGAERSVSVDLSATYLEWARKNLALNGVCSAHHRLVRADCTRWLDTNREPFDIILLDPPTFSNSKRMDATLDIQRDHATLITAAARHLSPGGLLIFSTNQKRFKLDPALNEALAIQDMTRWSLDKDFAGTRPAHQCWFVRGGPSMGACAPRAEHSAPGR